MIFSEIFETLQFLVYRYNVTQLTEIWIDIRLQCKCHVIYKFRYIVYDTLPIDQNN